MGLSCISYGIWTIGRWWVSWGNVLSTSGIHWYVLVESLILPIANRRRAWDLHKFLIRWKFIRSISWSITGVWKRVQEKNRAEHALFYSHCEFNALNSTLNKASYGNMKQVYCGDLICITVTTIWLSSCLGFPICLDANPSTIRLSASVIESWNGGKQCISFGHFFPIKIRHWGKIAYLGSPSWSLPNGEDIGRKGGIISKPKTSLMVALLQIQLPPLHHLIGGWKKFASFFIQWPLRWRH